jgi:hypothetical protein
MPLWQWYEVQEVLRSVMVAMTTVAAMAAIVGKIADTFDHQLVPPGRQKWLTFNRR